PVRRGDRGAAAGPAGREAEVEGGAVPGAVLPEAEQLAAGPAELRGGADGAAGGRGRRPEGAIVPAGDRVGGERRPAAGAGPRPRAGEPGLRVPGHRQTPRRLERPRPKCVKKSDPQIT